MNCHACVWLGALVVCDTPEDGHRPRTPPAVQVTVSEHDHALGFDLVSLHVLGNATHISTPATCWLGRVDQLVELAHALAKGVLVAIDDDDDVLQPDDRNARTVAFDQHITAIDQLGPALTQKLIGLLATDLRV